MAMIHSFSAADLNDRQTIASRWLANGAFAYFGSVHEPYLPAFRPPGLVSELIAAEVPLVAALRQGELEPFGFPWRLIYLGDPLYRVGQGPRAQPSSTAKGKKVAKSNRRGGAGGAAGSARRRNRRPGQRSHRQRRVE